MITISIKHAYWVDNYNDPLLSSDVSAVRRVAKWIGGRVVDSLQVQRHDTYSR